MITSDCKFCKKSKTKAGNIPAIFCSRKCKAEWQKTQKPVDKEWLIQKYIIEGLSTYDIAKIVDRNPKQVWTWLKGYDIQTRTVQEEIKKNSNYLKYRSGELINPLKGKKRPKEVGEKISKAKNGKPCPNHQGEKHWAFGRKGSLSPNWQGGISITERQIFYNSNEWKKVVILVRNRDGHKCTRCGCGNENIMRGNRIITNLCLHHIKPFIKYSDERCNPDNIITLCDKCHKWVHSKKNINKEFIDK